MKNTINIRCLEKFTLYNNGGKKLIADVKSGQYVAKLYKETEEYFSKDSKGREFLVGQLGDDNKIVLEQGFKLMKN
ncbi:hypothetical protein IRP63_14585 (plasmid) [Clostridium botulinum]|uniref:Uncharacterized protein n=1 Tax=Clostridium botulinum C/D str. DC5 TaxID=1443128 RepID=A0A0A0HZ26_CLOBO|nr:hypothetical protein [Clostridium botulinum]KGM93331.1 hypothetical protein Z955_15245 [Clostridium botulinum C/D str. DC5]KOA73891.1 hypothetical protein ADU78_11660 [Clostridium botulinum]KOA94050.1 hypothetical protein ADU76_04365 [Clostridium botulinum]KOC32881.1 hypothetical protein ADU81_10720 [Clostridium botulinum]KOC56175.1 hypothetical protein ADU89_03810 [Clostridium botulinum]